MRLTELLDQSGLPEGSGDLVDNEALSPEEQARILALTLAKAGLQAPEKGEKKTMKKSRFGLMLLAGVLCAGGVVASAAAYFQMDKGLARHLSAGDSQSSLVAQAGLDLHESAEAEGWTITAAQALGDRTQVRVLLEVTAPEGTVLGEGNYRLELPMLDPGVTFTIDNVEDDDVTDNRISFILASVTAKDYRGQRVKLHIGGVSRYKKYTVEELNAGVSPLDVDRLVTGDFDMAFTLDYQDTSVTYRPGAEVDIEDTKVRVEEVTLSPLSIFVKLSGVGTKVDLDALLAVAGGDGIPDGEDPGKDTFTAAGVEEKRPDILVVLDRSGSAIPWHTGDTEPDSITMTFTRIIDPAEVSAIVLNGVEIPLTK